MSDTGRAHQDADIIVIGSGHNGLVSAAYAARDGQKVLVLEKREDIGGAVCTRDMFGGFKMDIGGSLHCMIHRTPIITELKLARYGLEYIEVDPILSVPLEDGRAFFIFRSVERTCESIARISEEDAERYYRFVKQWQPLNRAVFDLFLQTPTFGNVFKTLLVPSHGMGGGRRLTTLAQLRLGYGKMIEQTFTHPAIRGAMAWWAAQSGPPPSQTQTAELFAWQSMLHEIGAFRPRGGSGALTRALQRCIEDHGGEVRGGAEVEQICTAGNCVSGVRVVTGQQFTAPIVIANAHVQIVFEHLLRHWTPPRLRRRIGRLPVGNGFGMILRCAMDRLPRYHRDSEVNRLLTTGVQLLPTSVAEIESGYEDCARQMPSRAPLALVMTFSALDATLAPPGKHTMFVWGQYYPYHLARGRQWSAIAKQEAARLLGRVERAAPGTRAAVRECYIQSPAVIAELHSMPNANIMHLEMVSRAMFMRRPLHGLHRYHTPLQGLFLASASAHPGGGISGAPGYNCYSAVRAWLAKSR